MRLRNAWEMVQNKLEGAVLCLANRDRRRAETGHPAPTHIRPLAFSCRLSRETRSSARACAESALLQYGYRLHGGPRQPCGQLTVWLTGSAGTGGLGVGNASSVEHRHSPALGPAAARSCPFSKTQRDGAGAPSHHHMPTPPLVHQSPWTASPPGTLENRPGDANWSHSPGGQSQRGKFYLERDHESFS